MGVFVEKTAELPALITRPRTFHASMAGASVLLLVATVIACRFTLMDVSVAGPLSAFLLLCAMLAPLALYWHEKGNMACREAVLVFPWEILLAITVPFTVLAAARLDVPLRDSFFRHADQVLGVSVPGMVAWAERSRLGAIINRSYGLLLPLLAVAGLLPVFTGKARQAREFLVANMVAFAIGIPAFALLPAVGPWYSYHIPPNGAQLDCQLRLLALRLPGPYVPSSLAAGIICFPSFHVIWSILCVAALWYLRPVRIPLVAVSAMIIVSTLTTGWHYFTDVLAGAVIAVFSLAVAHVLA